MYKMVDFRRLSVIFSKVRFEEEISITPEKPMGLFVSIQKGSGRFEVCLLKYCYQNLHNN